MAACGCWHGLGYKSVNTLNLKWFPKACVLKAWSQHDANFKVVKPLRGMTQ